MSITHEFAANSAKRHSVITRWSRNWGSCCSEPTCVAQRAVSRRPEAKSNPSAPAMRPKVALCTRAAASTSRAWGTMGARDSSSMPKSSAHSSSFHPESAQRRRCAPPEKIEQYTEPRRSSGVPARSSPSSIRRASSPRSMRISRCRRLSYQVYPGMSGVTP